MTAAIKSRSRPDENLGTILEVDIQSSLLPYVIPGMQTVVAKTAFADSDGQLLMHKIFCHYVASLTNENSDTDSEDSDADLVIGNDNLNERKKNNDPRKLAPEVIESMIGSEDDPLFGMDRERIEAEFGVKLTNEDIRRALRRIGDVALVQQVPTPKGRGGKQVQLDAEAYTKLRTFLKSYLADSVNGGDAFNFLFEWDSTPDESDNRDSDGEPRVRRHKPGAKDPLIKGQHHRALTVKKWRNVRFESIVKIADYNIDSRCVRISGAMYEKSNRIRKASFFEFSTDTTIKSGAHTAGNATERISNSRSTAKRQFAEALYFVTVDLDWSIIDKEHPELRVSTESRPKEFMLCYCRPISVHTADGLTILDRVPAGERTSNSKTRNRKYLQPRWLDVEDTVDIIGLIYCRQQEYVCWKDACWDSVVRRRIDPIRWKYGPRPLDSFESDVDASEHELPGSLDSMYDSEEEPDVKKKRTSSSYVPTTGSNAFAIGGEDIPDDLFTLP